MQYLLRCPQREPLHRPGTLTFVSFIMIDHRVSLSTFLKFCYTTLFMIKKVLIHMWNHGLQLSMIGITMSRLCKRRILQCMLCISFIVKLYHNPRHLSLSRMSMISIMNYESLYLVWLQWVQSYAHKGFDIFGRHTNIGKWPVLNRKSMNAAHLHIICTNVEVGVC